MSVWEASMRESMERLRAASQEKEAKALELQVGLRSSFSSSLRAV